MKRIGRHLPLAVLSVLIVGLFDPRPAGQAPDALWHYRNLGKAFYENPTTARQAVEEFRKALETAPDSVRERVNYGLALLRAGRTEEGIAALERAQTQDPSIPHTWFNLGIALKKEAQYERAIEQFVQMVALVPNEPVSHFNLGFLYKITGRTADAVKQFQTAAALNPNLAGPHFQLYSTYRDAGRVEDAARELALFQDIRKREADAAIREDLDWSAYAEILDPADPADARDDSPAAPLKFAARRLPGTFAPEHAGVLVIDADADGGPDLLAWSTEGVRLFKNGVEPVEKSGLDGEKQVSAIAAGDYNNDGFQDLAVAAAAGASIYTNLKGTFEKAAVPLPAGVFAAAVWFDYDHDYDVDLVLAGKTASLQRNNGKAGFSDQTNDIPFGQGTATDALVFNLVDNTAAHDLVVTYADRPAMIYRDLLAGRFRAEPLEMLGSGARSLVAQDVDNDGRIDLLAAGASGLTVLLNRTERFEAAAVPALPARAIAVGDFENRALHDVVVDGAVLRNQALGRFAAAGGKLLEPAIAVACADFNGDGRLDAAAIGADGALHLLRNETPITNAWTRVALTGVKNLKLAPGALVEVKAGSRYQKQTYQGVPLLFGLRGTAQIDTIRITWPNGLIQNETKQRAARSLSFVEAQRLSGSCPMIFTWNGREFEFITDVLGVAPLGASAGDGTYFPVDHDEYIQIPGHALLARDGQYEIRITEELREVAYLDRIQLIAVDHPAHVDIYTNDRFKGPPFPEFRLFGVERGIYPVSARDGHGRDVRPTLVARDRVYADGFPRNYAGVAELHTLDLDFGHAAPDNRAVLILNGWVDWADGSTFRAEAQADPRGLIFPSVQVKDAAGQWKRVLEDMGIPAGKPKTIAIDLTNKFLSASREVRIVTNLSLYWDEIFLGPSADAPHVLMTTIDPGIAELRFRGFSTPTIHPARQQPESFDYQQPMPLSMWNPTPGLYTRYGDVRSLATGVDDRVIIMGSGDELRLLFPATSLAPLKTGWRRDFLLCVDGWAKDGDANTAFSQTVEPLPFHAMSAYPYRPTERYPDTAGHRTYRETYNTRPALRLLRPLAASAPRSPAADAVTGKR